MARFARVFLCLLLLVFLLPSSMGFANNLDLTGIWSGALDLGVSKLDLVFHVELGQDGSFSGLMDVPAQGAKGIPITFVGEKDGKIVFDVALIMGVFTGEFSQDGLALHGVWEQSGMQLPLTLNSVEETEVPGFNRPQEPQPPYPYIEEEVSYLNEEVGIKLAGTLTKPYGEGPFPVVLLISGSGPQDRNEELMGHKPFLVLADYLTRRGIAVLRVDDRGVGESEGDFASATSLDFASDVLAGVEYLKTRSDLNPQQIGLIGHSEGGIIAPMVAAESPDVAFIVLMAGPGLNGEEISYLQSGLIQRAAGVPEEVVTRELELLREILTINREVENVQEAEQLIVQATLARIDELSDAEKEQIGDPDLIIQAQLAQILSPWFRFFQTYDPQPALTKVTCPVLAINGSKDLQVPAKENLTKIEEALQLGGNQNYTILELPNLNHLFQTAETGSPEEYMFIEETISPLALKTMGDWILAVVGGK